MVALISISWFSLGDAEEIDINICSQVQAGTLEASRPKSNNSQVVSSKEHEALCIAQVVPDHQNALQDVAEKTTCAGFICYH